MPAQSSISVVGDKQVIGALDLSFLPGIPKVFPGTLVANGPCYFGLVPNPGVPLAAVMIGPPMNIPSPLSLQVHGISNYFGVLNVIAVSNFTGLCTKFGVTIRNSASITNGVNTKNALNLGNAPSTFNGLVTVQGKLLVTGVISCRRIISPWLSAQLKQAFQNHICHISDLYILQNLHHHLIYHYQVQNRELLGMTRNRCTLSDFLLHSTLFQAIL